MAHIDSHSGAKLFSAVSSFGIEPKLRLIQNKFNQVWSDLNEDEQHTFIKKELNQVFDVVNSVIDKESNYLGRKMGIIVIRRMQDKGKEHFSELVWYFNNKCDCNGYNNKLYQNIIFRLLTGNITGYKGLKLNKQIPPFVKEETPQSSQDEEPNQSCETDDESSESDTEYL